MGSSKSPYGTLTWLFFKKLAARTGVARNRPMWCWIGPASQRNSGAYCCLQTVRRLRSGKTFEMTGSKIEIRTPIIPMTTSNQPTPKAAVPSAAKARHRGGMGGISVTRESFHPYRHRLLLRVASDYSRSVVVALGLGMTGHVATRPGGLGLK